MHLHNTHQKRIASGFCLVGGTPTLKLQPKHVLELQLKTAVTLSCVGKRPCPLIDIQRLHE